LYLLQNVSAIFLIILVVKSIDLFSVFVYDFVYDLFHLSCFDALVQRQYPVLKFNMRLLNYPHVDVPLTSYISLHRSPFSSSVSPSFPAFSTVSLMQVLGDVHSREKSGKYCTITCYTCFVPAVAHVRHDKLLPRHQEPRHRMYFYAGDAP